MSAKTIGLRKVQDISMILIIMCHCSFKLWIKLYFDVYYNYHYNVPHFVGNSFIERHFTFSQKKKRRTKLSIKESMLSHYDKFQSNMTFHYRLLQNILSAWPIHRSCWCCLLATSSSFRTRLTIFGSTLPASNIFGMSTIGLRAIHIEISPGNSGILSFVKQNKL